MKEQDWIVLWPCHWRLRSNQALSEDEDQYQNKQVYFPCGLRPLCSPKKQTLYLVKCIRQETLMELYPGESSLMCAQEIVVQELENHSMKFTSSQPS